MREALMEELEQLSFEEALQRLEALVAELDSGDLPLEEALANFEEGSKLKELCERKLAEAEAQVEELLAQSPETAGEGSPFDDQ
jgi:exodeoxyribonuclease VII small subunit